MYTGTVVAQYREHTKTCCARFIQNQRYTSLYQVTGKARDSYRLLAMTSQDDGGGGGNEGELCTTPLMKQCGITNVLPTTSTKNNNNYIYYDVYNLYTIALNYVE